jgi:RimJ/RimL family protein N-acetyltransferase
LRYFTDSDAAFVVQLVNSPTWLQFIGDRKVSTTEDAIAYLQRSAYTSLAINGFCMVLVEEIATGKAIGMNGLFKRADLAIADLGFALLPEYEGKGFAAEASKAIIELAFNRLDMNKLAAITDDTNTACQKLLSKLGFLQKGLYESKEFAETLLYFELAKAY